MINDPSSQEPETSGAIPEPSTWLTLVVGLGLTGAILRRRRRALLG